jgi:hypothetical protein
MTQTLGDLFLLPQSIYNWDTFPLFGNLEDIQDKRGIIQPYFYDFERIGKQCNQNCQVLYDPENCREYCRRLTEFYQTSLDYARQQCPSGTKECCKKMAPTNDYAYLACIKQKKSNETTNDSIWIVYLFLIIFVFFLLICITIKWMKNY